MSSNSCVILVMNYQMNDLCCVLPVENGTVLFLNVDPPLVFPVCILFVFSFHETNINLLSFFPVTDNSAEGLVVDRDDLESLEIPFAENVTFTCNQVGKPLRRTATADFRYIFTF